MRYDPELPISEEVGAEKHRQKGETFEDAMRRQARALADDEEHRAALEDIYLDRRFLNAGRVQKAAGSMHQITAFNCFVSGEIEDSMEGIMDKVKEAALTMQKGGGIGYDFSTIRPKGDRVEGLDSIASGVLSFMRVFDATCATVASAGNRRGAQMAVLRVDHPEIEDYVEAKCNHDQFTMFNMSVGATDAFMEAVLHDRDWDLTFKGKVYKTIRARDLWGRIMSATWDWAEPGVLFIDRINEMNNLSGLERINATNPCGEQPLPPYGACLLGSINWSAYVFDNDGFWKLDRVQLIKDIPHIVRALDNVIDRTIYPLPQQESEAKAKRRMGIGACGVANAVEAVTGSPYGSEAFREFCDDLQHTITEACYRASAVLAEEKGCFPLYDPDEYIFGEFIQRLSMDTRAFIAERGMRNSHLISMAPTGSISFAADNISSGIEPVFSYGFDRTVLMADGSEKVERVSDYGYRVFGVEGKTADNLTPMEHVSVLETFQKWTDSACSKTCNIGSDVTFEEFKDVYMEAWRVGAKGCTTFRADGKRFGILNVSDEEEDGLRQEELGFENPDEVGEGGACYIDPSTGMKSCD